ncbi:hypothetical protein [Saccharomonospora viridis]|uniref:Uncharacterized protein n=2 Tax=Saccharomonospora viridis TaxID=1852 RepID=C7MZ25_SACVD|nr:hypothetical protein [Saccharomonospora viridis]ACU96146.1 hypothetical protein Svir_10900 [Saccharomonospora viridis DSM 43017]KHF45351.1 hypothetical protein MINT15_05680 [Saccharomonospora viridis]SFP78762.1 hypothetical protein SAMN02982918_3430 [Saccharomonospora viridis]
MSREVVALLLFGLAGFLAGGAFSMWKRTRGMAVALGGAALLAVGGATAWLLS